MDIFKKSIENEKAITAPARDVLATPQPPEQLPVPPDSQQLAEARNKAVEQIHQIEHRIVAEREHLAQKIKEKEEEGISLKARLGMLVNRANQERENRDSTLGLLQQQIQRDLAEIEKEMESEIKEWTDRLSTKDKDLEEARHQAIFIETQKKIDAERSLRVLQASLEQLQQKCRALERQMLEEQNQWILKIKSREEEILNIKTQLSLRESQMKMDEEKADKTRAEMEAAWQEQIKELDARLEAQLSEWTRNYRSKEDELAALRTALEQRLSSIHLENERKEKEIKNIGARAEEKIKVIEVRLADDRSKWQDILRVREEEFKQLKAERVLRESQEKAEREKKYQEFKEEENAANRRLVDIRQRIEEEKEKWVAGIKAKEEELKVLKIQAELKLKETRDGWEKRKNEAERERGTMDARIIELTRRFGEEKASWQRELSAKNAGIEAYQKEWQEKQNLLLEQSGESLAGMRDKNEAMHNEFAALQAKCDEEKHRCHDLLGQKERELQFARREYEALEASARREIEILEAQLAREQQPLMTRIEDMEKKIATLRSQAQAEIAGKEAQLKAIGERYQRQEETLKRNIIHQAAQLKETEDNLHKRIQDIRAQLAAQAQQVEEKLVGLQAEEKDIREKLSTEKEKVDREKTRLTAHYTNLTEELQVLAEKLEKDYAVITEKLKGELDAKTHAVETEKAHFQSREETLNSELVRTEQELAAMKGRGDEEVAQLSSRLAMAQSEQGGRIKSREEELGHLQKTLEINTLQWQKEIVALKNEMEGKLEPLFQHKSVLESRIAEETKNSQEKLVFLDNEQGTLRTQSARRQEELTQHLDAKIEKIRQTENGYRVKIDDLRSQIELYLRQAGETLEKLAQRREELQQTVAREEEKAQREKNQIAQHYENQSAQINGEIQRLENEYEELRTQTKAAFDLRHQEAEAEHRKLKEIESSARQSLVAKDDELSAAEMRGREVLAVATAELSRTRENMGQLIRAKEEAIAALQNTIKTDKIRFQEEIEILRTQLVVDIRPLSQKRQELESALARENREASEKLVAVQVRIEALKAEQVSQESAHLLRFDNLNTQLAQAKIALEKNIVAIHDERAQAEAEFAGLLEGKEGEYRNREQELNAQRESYLRQKERARQDALNTTATLATEIETLQKEITRLEKEYPQLLSTRQEEIAALEKQIVQQAAFFQQQQEQAEKSLENFQRRIERRIQQARGQLTQLQERHATELAVAEERLARMTGEMEKKIAVLQDEINREGKIFAEEKYKLEKQKIELEEKLKDLQFISREQLRQKEKEILVLQTELAEKERSWEENWKHKEQELAQEKALLVQEFETLEKSIQDEDASARRRLTEKENEIAYFQNQYTARIENLGNEIGEKKRSWEEGNARLDEQVRSLSDSLGGLESRWNEEKTAKDKELSVLRSNVEFWELRAATEEERRLAAWEDEKITLETRLKDAAEALSISQKEAASKLEEKERILAKISEDARKLEEEKLAQWNEQEAHLIHQRERLATGIAAREKELKLENARIEKERKELEREIEKLKLESALKDTTMLAEAQKAERRWRKLQHTLEGQLTSLTRQVADARENWAARLREKDEEIDTLRVRLSLRDERRQGEIKRRREDSERVLAELNGELKTMAERAPQDMPSHQQLLKARQEELAALCADTEQKEQRWQREQAGREEALNARYNEITQTVAALEQQLKEDGRRFEELLESKSAQIGALTGQMGEKEEILRREHEYSQHLADTLRAKKNDFKKELAHAGNPGIEARQTAEMNLQFEEAISHYNRGDYAGAKKKLTEILALYKEFPGAYQYIALCHWNLGDRATARKMAERALELEPHNGELKTWIDTIRER